MEKKNPFVVLVDRHGPGYVAKMLKQKNHTTISIYYSRISGRGRCGSSIKRAAKQIPAEWVIPLCHISEFQPHDFRPDIYLPTWRV